MVCVTSDMLLKHKEKHVVSPMVRSTCITLCFNTNTGYFYLYRKPSLIHPSEAL